MTKTRTTGGMRSRARRPIASLGLALALSLCLAGSAGADAEFEFQFGSAGTGAGQFQQPTGLAANASNGKIYVADRNNNRIQVFDETGSFLEAWGYDVVASGEDDEPPASEVQRITVKAVGGTFRLSFQEQVTDPIPYNASAATVEAQLDALGALEVTGGVTVSGGPGDGTGSNPYVVTFAGTANRAQISMEQTALVRAVGTELECESTGPEVFSRRFARAAYQWIANGDPIPGATSDVYTTTAADSGKAIQCEIEGTFEPFGANEVQKSWDTNGDHTIIGSGGSPTPPLGPASIAEPAGPTIPVGSGGGQTLTCNAGSWSNSPDTYTYQWYLGYEPYGPPTTTSATSDEITLTAQDTAERTAIQCRVKATNASGSSAMWSELKLTTPPPPGLGGGPDIELATPRVLEHPDGDPVTGVATRVHGGPGFEICKASPPSTDVCKAGLAGDGVGQFSKPRGIAVDNSPAGGGAVYVGDDLNYRVQKFAADGTPLRMFGGRIDKTTGENVCVVVVSGHDCGAGVRILTHKLGFLRGNPCPSGCPMGTLGFQEFGNTVGVDPNNGNVYVTDAGDFEGQQVEIGERTQAFDSDGNVFGQAFTPSASRLDGGHATSVAVDIGSRILVTKTGGVLFVNVFEEAQFTAEGGQTPWTERKVIHDKGAPLHIGTDPGRDKIWIVDKNSNLFGFGQDQVCGESETIFPRFALVAYDHRNRELSCTVPQGSGQIPNAAGIAVTENNRAFVSLWKNNVIKAYKLPQETAPTVDEISISEVSSTSIKLQGRIRPGFEETEYSFEYGTSPCSSNPCEVVPGSDTVNGLEPRPVAEVATGLEPGTKYYYRLVATNPFGTDVGPEKTFTPFPRVDLTVDPCPNALARKQTRTAELLDCRAYELASAGFTGGYDVISDLAPGAEPYDGFPGADDKVLYSVRDGGIPGTGSPTNRGPDPYVATRGADGWTTEYVGIPADGTPSPSPFSSTLSDADGGLSTFAFAENDICSPCFDDESSGIPVRGPDGALEQGMTGSIPQPAAAQAGYVADRMSEDGRHLVFGSTAQFEPAGNDNGDVTIYDRDLSNGTTQVVSTLPDGSTMTGSGIGELDISADGSRIVVGQKVSTDGSGNGHWHPYLHVGTEAESVDLAPGTSAGVLYLGMSDDGTRAFYSTADQLVASDTDTSADIYEAEVSEAGPITPRLVSIGSGGPSNSDACEPVGAPAWNTVAGEGMCNAVGFAGGAGVAGDGTVYFLSPELLTGPGDGIADEPNLYVVRPGDDIEFVATPDTSAGTSPPPPIHPVVDPELVTGLSGAGPVAVDQENGDLYVSEPEEARIKRYDATGAPANFPAGPFEGTNELSGVAFGSTFITQLAIDNASTSPLKGSLYGTKLFEGVDVYSTTGAPLGSLSGFEFACGVAVNQSSGVVYVADGFASKIYRFEPTSAPSPGVSNANYSVTSLTSTFGESIACQLAADSSGTVYAAGLAGPIKAFDESEFEASGPFRPGTEVFDPGNVPPNQTIGVDPSTDELYVNNGSKVVIFDAAHDKVTEFGNGNVTSFGGVAINSGEGTGQSARTHHAYAVNGSNLVEFGFEPDIYQAIDDPAIVHAVHDNEVHRWTDFQTSRSGDFALLTSELPLAEDYDNRGFRMVHRYDITSGDLACVSCLPSEAEPNADASMPTHGLGITEDGRAFFNSDDQLALRDQNEKKDAYEWKDGATSLVSTGVSSAPSSMLTVTEDGRDAFFFTRETLVESDRNGQAMKLYDAREEGGFFQLPPSPHCRASDECHGPGTQAAPPPPIGTYRGAGGNVQPTPKRKRCKKGFVRRKGKCVKRRKRRAHGKHKRKRGKPSAGRGSRRNTGGSR